MTRPRLIVAGARLALAALAATTLWFALYPGSSHPRLLPWDWAEHFGSFAILMAVLLVAAPRTSALRLAIALLAAGGAIEVVQATLVHRDGEWRDWLVEFAACLAAGGMVVASAVRRKLQVSLGDRRTD